MTQPSDPRVLLHNAEQLARAGRLREAEAAYTQLLTQWPDLPDTWYNLAMLQRRAGRFDAALASYQQALDRGISQPEEAHLNRGVIYADCLRQEAAAERELLAALKLNPTYVPALLNLANLREDFGRRSEAIALYEQILAVQPDCWEALARFASAQPAPSSALVGRLRQAIAQPSVTAADKASLAFALGKMLDASGAYDQAFDAYVEANRHSRESASPQPFYDRRHHEAFIDQLIAMFPGAPAPSTSPKRSASPIFICGMFRSGSTLVEQALAAHSRVTAGGEISFLPSVVRTELAPFPAAMARVGDAQLEGMATRYQQLLTNLFPHAELVTDKRPDNFLYIGLIKRLFPGARVVHTTRSPLDNCLSIFFLHLDHRMAYALDLLDTAHYYAQYRRLMAHWKSLYASDILDFSYDSFVRDPRAQLAKLLAFCGLDWEENCLSFDRAGNAVKTASVWQVREPLYQRSSGRWRNYAAQLAPVQHYLQAACPDVDFESM